MLFYAVCNVEFGIFFFFNYCDYITILQVRAGIYRQFSMTSSEFVTSLTNIYIHPDYSEKTNLNDIAIAKVQKPFPFNSFIAKTCLPKDYSDDLKVPKSDETCYTMGWGKTGQDSWEISDTLQEVQVPIWENCPKDEKFVVCGGFKSGQNDTCQGKTHVKSMLN